MLPKRGRFSQREEASSNPVWLETFFKIRMIAELFSYAGPHAMKTSASYRIEVWRLGLLAVRLVPLCVCRGIGRVLALLYCTLRPQRVDLVTENLAPVLSGDRIAARKTARTLITNFSLKMADLFRIEAGCNRDLPVFQWSGYEHFQEASARGRGVLLVTVHVGNWEYGGYLLGKMGVNLLVLTQAEPSQEFTEIRQQARARAGIETLVVGQDALGFVTIIKRLAEGASVALLMDRPSPATAVTVDFFGRPFRASVAAAELARASGAAIIPVYIVQEGGSYSAHILPEVTYDRQAIGNREGRRRLTGEILQCFEPIVRQYPDQWYQFVPIWTREENPEVVHPL